MVLQWGGWNLEEEEEEEEEEAATIDGPQDRAPKTKKIQPPYPCGDGSKKNTPATVPGLEYRNDSNSFRRRRRKEKAGHFSLFPSPVELYVCMYVLMICRWRSNIARMNQNVAFAISIYIMEANYKTPSGIQSRTKNGLRARNKI